METPVRLDHDRTRDLEVGMAAEAAQRGDWVWAEPPGDGSARPVLIGNRVSVGQHGDPTVIDCDRCAVRGAGCGDCVVTVLLGGPPEGVQLDAVEERALTVLAEAGLVPPLRMVGPEGPDPVHG